VRRRGGGRRRHTPFWHVESHARGVLPPGRALSGHRVPAAGRCCTYRPGVAGSCRGVDTLDQPSARRRSTREPEKTGFARRGGLASRLCTPHQ
jgi:hypothetical protein